MKWTSNVYWTRIVGLCLAACIVEPAALLASDSDVWANIAGAQSTALAPEAIRPAGYLEASDAEPAWVVPTGASSASSEGCGGGCAACGECGGCANCAGCGEATACCDEGYSGCGTGCKGRCSGCCKGSRFVTRDRYGVKHLFGFIRESDHAFDGFISPQTNVLLFEDPRTLTEARAHFVNQWIPNGNPVFTQGGTAQYAALQIRAAITERLSIIATKDGYIWLNGVGNPALQTSGVADLAAGLKYNVIRNPETQTLLSVGGVVEAPLSGTQVFQGFGTQIHMFATGGKKLNLPVNSHWISGAGLRVPTNNNLQSEMIYWSNQWDVEVVRHVYGTFSANWFHWLSSGNNFPGLNFEGGDLFNLGSGQVAGTDIVTLGWGTRYKPNGNREFGVAYENPVTQQRGLMASRIYVDAIFRF
jgi:hypothetical protein